MPIPADHPQRLVLNDEVHARPYAQVEAPERIAFLALFAPDGDAAPAEALGRLFERMGQTPPSLDQPHVTADFGAFRLKWERHSEFVSYTFFQHGAFDAPFSGSALDAVPADWLSALDGQTIVASRIAVMPAPGQLPAVWEIAQDFADHPIVGSAVAAGRAYAFTDFRIHSDRLSRFLLFDRALGRYQAGRVVQRLCEIETYRMMALLGFPVARRVGSEITLAERELSALTERMVQAGPADEPQLLNQLTRLAAAVERSVSVSNYRFSAAQAYYDLARNRIRELREERIPGLQTISEFMERRLAPAMNTCESVAKRQDELSARITRSSDLLRTRVDIEREQQNLEMLAQMNRRARLQLRLQQTVEGLSVAAITYYAVGLIGYIAKAAKSFGVHLDPNVVVGVSIPAVAVLVALGVHRIRKTVTRAAQDESGKS
ncbi:MAG TPA: DUF3422 domain-containing protein [Burkholderiales bacterium]|nr:DUF3422 domain-containing protein [Burkholderiales bacterium]